MVRIWTLLAGSLAGLLLLAGEAGSQAAPPRIAVAANLEPAMGELLAAFEEGRGYEVTPVYGSSGNLARQIQQGAPFTVFLSADAAHPERLVEDGLALGPSVVYALGRLALLTAQGADIAADEELEDLGHALADGRLRHLAIANPELAPYGRAAVEVLEAKGLWERAQGRLVTGENVAQAAQYVLSGAAEAAFVALAQAKSPALEGRASSAAVPADLHAPIEQRMVLMKGADAASEAFFLFMQSPEALAILGKWGYGTPAG